MKKAAAVILTLILIISCFTGSVFAVSSESEQAYSLEDYANMDLETASAPMRERILEAREKIIFSSSWAADGVEMGIFNVETGEIVERLPSFSSLFPGWDMPVFDVSESKQSYSVEDYANMDLETASAPMREKILEAREKIIFSSSWAADGVEMGIFNVETGEIVERLPSFSSLFPGWDMPVMDVSKEIDPDLGSPKYFDMDSDPSIHGSNIVNSNTFVRSAASGGAMSNDGPTQIRFNNLVYLNAASDTVNADPFYTFTTEGFMTTVQATYLSVSEHYNIGFSNANTGASLGYATNIPYGVGTYLIHEAVRCAIRASTYSNPGWSNMVVRNDASIDLR